ncbi:MAG: TMEM43 family protein [Lysobacterales bacterium]
MPVVVRENISWWSRLKQSFIGFLLSFVIVIAALFLLAWNEHRTLKNYKGLRAAGETVQSVSADPIDPSADGKLIHFSAEVRSSQGVRDPDFGIEAPALVLRRSVEMYQWREKKETTERDKLGGGKERVTTYSYEKVWDDDAINSSDFQESGHNNPGALPYQDARFAVTDARIGARRAADNILNALNSSALQLGEAGVFPDGFRRTDAETIYRGNNPASPQIGDVRVRYRAVPPQMASVIAQANGDGLLPWTSPAGTEIFLVETGQQSAAAMVEHAQSSNSALGWVLRAVGFGLLWIAFSMMLGPLKTIAAVLPPLGRAVGMFTGGVAFVLAAVMASVTIVLSWIFVRPLWAVSIVLAIIAVIAMWSRKSAKPAQAAAGMPPPMPPPPPPPR